MPRIIYTKQFQFWLSPRHLQDRQVTGEPVLVTTPEAEAALAAGVAFKPDQPEGE